jgi:dienelactone hydrolase
MGDRYEYRAGDVDAKGYRALPERPNGGGVLIVPAFWGLRDFEISVADAYAEEGYAVLAADYYGEGKVASDMDEAGGWMSTLNEDRERLLGRISGALDALNEFGGTRRVAATGYCFGGKAVLDLARSGADFAAAVSQHGIYDRPSFETKDMKAAVLLCHGWDDPLATPEQFVAVTEELTEHCPDWHALCFGGTGHAFTNPAQTGDPGSGMGYVERSAERTDRAVRQFLADKLLG